jgi:hypothetical protein
MAAREGSRRRGEESSEVVDVRGLDVVHGLVSIEQVEQVLCE